MIGRLLPIALFLALGLLLAAGLKIADHKTEIPSPLIGKPMPDFTLPVLGQEGLMVSSEDLLMPWHFAFTRETADLFGIRIEFVGSKTWGIGAGFDRFWCAVPEPGTLSLLALGVAVLGAPRRRPAA
jgi:hypothetical protein